jgi:hypothetical protein
MNLTLRGVPEILTPFLMASSIDLSQMRRLKMTAMNRLKTPGGPRRQFALSPRGIAVLTPGIGELAGAQEQERPNARC